MRLCCLVCKCYLIVVSENDENVFGKMVSASLARWHVGLLWLAAWAGVEGLIGKHLTRIWIATTITECHND